MICAETFVANGFMKADGGIPVKDFSRPRQPTARTSRAGSDECFGPGSFVRL